MLTDFWVWHFKAMPRRLFAIWRGVLIFIIHFFALSYHFSTFFKPWHRQMARHGRGFDLKEWLGVAFFNTFGRVVGMILRTFLILGGGLSLILTGILGGLFIFGWLVLPMIIIWLIIDGFIGFFE